MDRPAAPADVVSLSVHGPSGVLDLHVPVAALTLDVAVAYARRAGLRVVPTLQTPLGAVLAPGATLAEADVGSGAVLVAVLVAGPPAPAPSPGPGPGADVDRGAAAGVRPRPAPGRLSALGFTGAAVAAVLAGLVAARLPDGSGARTATLVLLAAAAVVGVLPVGALAAQRVLAAPAFAGAASFALVWSPGPARLPIDVGVAALAAAVAAAVARALDRHAEEALRTWVVAGAVVFAVAALGALADVEAPVVWGVLLGLALLAARFVPTVAVDVPDRYLLDVDRPEPPVGVPVETPIGVPVGMVEAVAASGRRLVEAASVAVLVVAVTSGALLLRSATDDVDQVGARVMVGLTGAFLLLVAGSHRHATARAALRVAGVVLLAELAVVLGLWLRAPTTGPAPGGVVAVVLAVAVLAGALVVAGVALGRGRRSVWWERRAELAEAVCGSAALASLVVVLGFFRRLWETSG